MLSRRLEPGAGVMNKPGVIEAASRAMIQQESGMLMFGMRWMLRGCYLLMK